jgi:hypothetical protein
LDSFTADGMAAACARLGDQIQLTDNAPTVKRAYADTSEGRERCRYIDLNTDPRTIRSFTIPAEQAQVCYESLDAACVAVGL